MTTTDEIRAELYHALESLGAGSDLLSIVGSWGDTLPDEEVLGMLKDWNAGRDREAMLAQERAAMLRAVRASMRRLKGMLDPSYGFTEGD